MMLERLLELPDGAKNLKENVTLPLGMVGQLSTSREINAAWNETKNKAAKLHPDKFILDERVFCTRMTELKESWIKQFQVQILENLMSWQILKNAT